MAGPVEDGQRARARVRARVGVRARVRMAGPVEDGQRSMSVRSRWLVSTFES
jgi:hypothetical protein